MNYIGTYSPSDRESREAQRPSRGETPRSVFPEAGAIRGLLALPLVLASLCLASSAATWTIASTDGVGDVVALTNALTELKATASTENNYIWLEPGLYDLSGTHMNASSHLSASGSGNVNLTIAALGNGPEDTVLRGGGSNEAHRVLNVGGGGNYGWTIISNLTVTGGWSTNNSGGGICSDGQSTRYFDLIVTNNFAAGYNATGAGGCFRGQAYNCLFADNVGGVKGGSRGAGAFYADGVCNIKPGVVQGAWDCVFTNNTLYGNRGGGAMLLGGGKVVRCKFYDNSAFDGGGGAISIHASSVNATGVKVDTLVADCTFVGNSAYYGGALWNMGCIVSNCTFTGNRGRVTWSVASGGGAIHANTTPAIIDSTFTSNSITYGQGGAVHVEVAGGVVSNCAFVGNSAPIVNAGALSAPYGVTISDCVFTNNLSGGGYAGAIYAATSTVARCEFVGNSVTNGSGGAIMAKAAVISNCLFYGNTAYSASGAVDTTGGGAIFSSGAYTNTIADCIFDGNIALKWCGGAIHAAAMDIARCSFTHNQSFRHGGAVYVKSGACSLTDCEFVDNRVTNNAVATGSWHHGGAIHGLSTSDRAKATRCSFTGGYASGYAAIAYNVDLVDCLVTDTVSPTPLLYDCNLSGCRVAGNSITVPNISVDHSTASGKCTNVNSIVENNSSASSTYGCAITRNKVIVNCTYATNSVIGGNYSTIVGNSVSYNSVFIGNNIEGRVADVKTWFLGSTAYVSLTNCVYGGVYGDDDSLLLTNNCVQTSNIRFSGDENAPYAPKRMSVLRDRGAMDDWILEMAGDIDFYGNPRVMFGTIDIGAAECQAEAKGLYLIFR